MSDWIRITISVRKPTASRVIQVKNDYGLSYDELLNEYIRLKAKLMQHNKDNSMLYELNK